MEYIIEKLEDGFQLTFVGEEPQTFKDIVELEAAVLERMQQDDLARNSPIED